MHKTPPFHLAIPVDNLEEARIFYRETLGCEEGRSSDHWVDFNFFGHQLVIHYKEKTNSETSDQSNPVDGKQVPIPHFGVVLEWAAFQSFANELKEKTFLLKLPHTSGFEGKVGEQATMFLKIHLVTPLSSKPLKT